MDYTKIQYFLENKTTFTQNWQSGDLRICGRQRTCDPIKSKKCVQIGLDWGLLESYKYRCIFVQIESCRRTATFQLLKKTCFFLDFEAVFWTQCKSKILQMLINFETNSDPKRTKL